MSFAEPTIHINWTRYSCNEIAVIECPTCKGFTEALARFQEWYGWTETCLCCGDRWTDGEMHERPFKPRWRKENIERAQRAITELGLRYPPPSHCHSEEK